MVTEIAPVKAIPNHVDMYWPTLQALKEMGGSGTIQELDDKVIRLAGFTEAQHGILHQKGPQTELAYRLAWVRTHLRMVGALDNSSRGVWAITDQGRSLKQEDTMAIPGQLRPRYRGRTPLPPVLPPVDVVGTIVEKSSGKDEPFSSTEFPKWRDKLLEVLLRLSPDRFERLCQRILRESGFTRVDVLVELTRACYSRPVHSLPRQNGKLLVMERQFWIWSTVINYVY